MGYEYYKHKKKGPLISKERGQSLNLDKFDGDDEKRKFKPSGSLIMPEDGLKADMGDQRGTVSLKNIQFNLQNNVTMDEIKQAGLREPTSPRAYQMRIRELQAVVMRVKKNKDVILNGRVDDLLDKTTLDSSSMTRPRSKSADILPSH
jgi:hypothetical protein